MKIRKSTRNYEAWLAKRTPIIEADVVLKHRHMKEALFPFMRATFYRWAQVFPEVCKVVAAAPQVLSVGDLHVENFGTWRDAEGRLIWGVNDFDEAYPAPYTNDLVRLAASAAMANREADSTMKVADVCEALLEGYTAGIESGGQPFVLGEHHEWLRRIAEGELRDPVAFWRKLDGLPPLDSVPKNVLAALRKAMPDPDLTFKVAHRVAGLGSLGRTRYLALGQWQGGLIAREMKSLVASSFVYARGEGDERILYNDILSTAVRAQDPFLVERGGWVLRRLSPHCSRVELSELPTVRAEARLLHAMGFETANVHVGTRGARKEIRKDLEKRGRSWLTHAAHAMFDAVEHDWKEWRDQWDEKKSSPREAPVEIQSEAEPRRETEANGATDEQTPEQGPAEAGSVLEMEAESSSPFESSGAVHPASAAPAATSHAGTKQAEVDGEATVGDRVPDNQAKNQADNQADTKTAH